MIRQVDEILSLQEFTHRIGTESQYLVQDFTGGLFHYTDLNALINIVTTHDLWLTNSRYSNDENELNHGYKIASEVIIEKRNKSVKNTFKRKYLDHVEDFLKQPPQGVYICCFCGEDNLLSQWRSYGENGTGVSIGFNPGGFTRFTGPDLSPEQFGLMRLWKVYYDDVTKKNIIQQALELMPDLHYNESEDFIARRAADAIHFFLPTFKDIDFQEENERRLIFTPSINCRINPKFRCRKQMLVPFYSLNSLIQNDSNIIERLPLISITCGPSVTKEINKESIEMMLSKNGYESAMVKVSDTPYRG
jgi:hypothetical protein